MFLNGEKCVLGRHVMGKRQKRLILIMITVAIAISGLLLVCPMESVEPQAINECRSPAYARVIATAYTSRSCETDDTPHQTATMSRTQLGIIGVSRDIEWQFPMGSRVCFWYAGRVQTFFVQDRMNARWRNRIDVWMPTVAEAMRFGKQSLILWG